MGWALLVLSACGTSNDHATDPAAPSAPSAAATHGSGTASTPAECDTSAATPDGLTYAADPSMLASGTLCVTSRTKAGVGKVAAVPLTGAQLASPSPTGL